MIYQSFRNCQTVVRSYYISSYRFIEPVQIRVSASHYQTSNVLFTTLPEGDITKDSWVLPQVSVSQSFQLLIRRR